MNEYPLNKAATQYTSPAKEKRGVKFDLPEINEATI